MKSQSDREIVLVRTFDAPRERVWKAWTDPKQVAKWWGPSGFTDTISLMEVRPGGAWRHVMHGPDGTDYREEVTFDEVVEPELLAFTHAESAELGLKSFASRVTFEDEGDKTRVTLRSVFASKQEREKQVKEVGAIEGGTQTLARLADFLAENYI